MSRFAQQMTFLSATELEPDTLKWLDGLRDRQRPVVLARDYPRVTNRIAFLWQEPPLMRKYFEDLTLADSGGRKGFTPEAMLEIGTLRNVYDRLHPVSTDPWHKATVLPETTE